MAHSAPACPRRLGSGYAWRISAMEAGIMAAAPTPCARRAATSTANDGAHPQAIDARTNTTSTMPNARRAPMRSTSAPADSSSAPNIRV
ncbi:hypothetical protein G6F24_018843 [Rhizopus arrhizus]|nr:hypothetical protein G6F24_018843 [Rhizopus arrhizus]